MIMSIAMTTTRNMTLTMTIAITDTAAIAVIASAFQTKSQGDARTLGEIGMSIQHS